MSTRPPAALRIALRLYPAAYRAEHQRSMVGVFLDATEGAGRLAVAREVVGIAVHGARVRTALTSSRTPGRLATEAAPYALGSAAALSVWTALPVQTVQARAWGRMWGIQPYSLPGALALVLLALWVLAAATAAVGLWTTARTTAVLAAATALVSAPFVPTSMGPAVHQPAGWVLFVHCTLAVPAVLWALLLLAAPADLLRTVGRRSRRTVPVTTMAVLRLLEGYSTHRSATSPQLVVPGIVCLGLVWANRDRLAPAALAVALLPLLLSQQLYTSAHQEFFGNTHSFDMRMLPPLLPVAALAVAAVRLRRRPVRPAPLV